MFHPLRGLARALSEHLYAYPGIHAAFKRCFLALPPALRGRQMIWDALVTLAKQQAEVCVLQIGANDGEQADPVAYFIRKHGWRAVLVEPVPSIFAQLRQNYAGCADINFVNAAISAQDEVRAFYYLDDPRDELPAWARGLGSFLRDEVVNHQVPGRNILDYLRQIDVPCLALASLLAQHHVDRVDVLVIDTQGYDHHIVKQIPFDRIRPRIVIYEHMFLSTEDRRACDALLQVQGYVLESDRWDVLGTLSERRDASA